jgi:hypothetical protein
VGEELKCGQPTGGVIGGSVPQEQAQGVQKEVKMTVMARVGKEAPDFSAPAFHKGNFEQIKLSDFRGHWLMLCFYPGDFTFV